MANNNLIEEYKECNSNLRHYSNMRFAELTLFFAINAGLLSVLSDNQSSLDQLIEFLLRVLGILISILFAVMNDRRVALWVSLKERAVEIENQLELEQYQKRPKAKFLSNRNMAKAIYYLFILFWSLFILREHTCLL